MNHPWLIEISQGQHVRFSLVEFAGSDGYTHNVDGTGCNMIFGYISEPSSGANSSICGGVSRERELYTSTSNRVQIQVVNSHSRDGTQFLLKYEGNE